MPLFAYALSVLVFVATVSLLWFTRHNMQTSQLREYLAIAALLAIATLVLFAQIDWETLSRYLP